MKKTLQTSNKPLKALIYCRVSSDRQKNEGHGLESQEHRCKVYAQSNGYELGPNCVFSDSFTGAGDFMNRPAMVKLLNYIDSKPYEKFAVIFDDLKRFSRDVEFHIKLRIAFKSREVKLVCLNFDFNDSPEGEYSELIMSAGAQLERRQNQRQVIQKQRARLEAGYWPFFPPPGYESYEDPAGGKILRKNKKAKSIKEAFEGFASERFINLVDVQKYLSDNDFCDGKPVYPEKVKRLLVRVIYAGYVEYPDWNVSRRKGKHEPIISLETFEKVQDKLFGRLKIRTKSNISLDFLLRNFVDCAECSKPMTASWSTSRNGEKVPYYRCGKKPCSMANVSIRRKDMEDRFAELLKKIKPKDSALAITKLILTDVWKNKIANIEKNKDTIKRNLDEIKLQINSFLDRINKTTSEVVIDSYEKRIEELSNQELLLTEDLEKANLKYKSINFETALDITFGFLKNPYESWINGDPNTKKLVLKLVFAGNIKYDRIKGFETANLSLPLRVFELSDVSNSQVVEMVGKNLEK